MTPEPPFARHLQPGETLLWSDRPGFPCWLRRLGIPPRSSAHVLAIGVGLTAALAGVLATRIPELSATQRLVAGLSGGAPLAALALSLLYASWRRGRTAYALTSAGRALRRAGGRVSASSVAGARLECEPNLAFGVLHLQGECFDDVAYPAALEPILARAQDALRE